MLNRQFPLPVHRLALAAVAAGALALLPAARAGAEAVVIASTAPDLPAGQVIADGDAIVLPEGTTVTLITQAGETLTLTGPHESALDPASGRVGTLSTIAQLVQGPPDDLSTLGATRGGFSAGSIPELESEGSVVVTVGRATSVCVAPDEPPTLRRRAVEGELRLTLVADDGPAGEVYWAADQHDALWPEALPLVDGVDYLIRENGSDATVRVRVMARNGKGEVEWISALAEAGCMAQAYVALTRLRDQSVPLSLYVTTSRGRQPLFQVGDDIRLKIQSNRDSFVYCYYLQSDGLVVPLFPMSESGGAYLAANTLLELPGPRLVGDLQVAPPVGRDQVSCFATDRDVTAELPRDVVPLDFTPLPGALAASLAQLFTSLGDVEVAEVRLPIEIQ
ncbi:MAG: DUF4384 domain-containing protein [Rhodospirillaceae bacterium]|nr:DUF4384 domain-containing protein [Rhodospirillaceae bacterium]